MRQGESRTGDRSGSSSAAAGSEILNAIERQDYAVLGRRPAISKSRKLALVARAALGKLFMTCLGVSR